MNQQTNRTVVAKKLENNPSAVEPLQIKFRYEEIREAIRKKNYSSLPIDVVSQTSHYKECQIRTLDVLGCKVRIWFEKNCDPEIYLISEGRLAKIYITDLIKDTAFYEHICDKKSA